MKKILFHVLLCLGLLASCGAKKNQPPVSLVWEMGENGITPGYFECTFHLTNTGTEPLTGNWAIYYTQLSVAPPAEQENAPLKIEQISASYNKMTPTAHFTGLAPGETLSFTCRQKGSIIRESGAPQDVYIVFSDKNGKEGLPQALPLEVQPFEHEYQYKRPKDFPYADGKYMYEQNAFFNQAVELEPTDIFPSVKHIEKQAGVSRFTADVNLKYDTAVENEAALLKESLISQFGCTVSDAGKTVVELNLSANGKEDSDEYYEIWVRDNRFCLSSPTPHGIFDACQTLLNMLGNSSLLPVEFTNMQIADRPDSEHRGIMLDVARNFTKKENVLKLLDYLASYKINVLHLHLTDDEAWRIEIPGLEELTQIASRRGHTTDESTCLYPAYAWGWDASDTASLANGYYARNDFMDILKYARKRHIKVIPEVDVPGHSRAAIKAMNARYKKYAATDRAKAEEYLLTDFADTSKYVSAQHYTDNVVNVAMPSTYRFVEKVIDEIDKMYREAGLPLTVFHIGGDEVARGAWTGSAVCRNLMQEKGMTEVRELKDYFLEQTLPMLARRNIQPAGWEEVAMKPDNTANERFKNSNVLSYCWNTVPEWKGDEVPYKLANAGYPVILGNVTNCYLDMAYCNHQQETGLYWGGYVDEYCTFDMLPYDIYKSVKRTLKGEPVDASAASKFKTPLNKDARVQIKGIQGQIWAETVRSFEQVEYFLFPKMLGLAERAWNMQPEWADEKNGKAYETAKRKYNAQIALRELPRLAKKGANFRTSPPGLLLQQGLLYANTAIPDAVIRYTTDGSEPTENSAQWTEPVACNAGLIKAKVFFLGKSSITIRLANN
ncbi:MAG: carbohydate-binding domain-containing protein [Prevotella sp.]|jgi:hexosaminidase|nr:carbohydate-binding domain-containing protein [Prevotella sp.]